MDEIRLPKYERVATVLRKRIILDIYPVGSQLPPEPELQKEFEVSRATIRSAIQLLVRQGLIAVHQGRGTTVLRKGNTRRFDNVVSLSEINETDVAHTIARIDEVPLLDPEDAAFLQLPQRSIVYRYQRIFCGKDGTPVMFATNFLAKKTVPDFAAYEGSFSDLYTFLEKAYGIRFQHAEESISAEAAGLVESQVLKVPVGAPLISTHRLAFSTAGPMECSRFLYRPDLYRIVVTMED